MGSDRDTRAVLVPVLAMAGAAFSFAFQETSLISALQHIAHSLPGASTSTVTFLESGYLVVAAISGPTLGRLGDRRGKKAVILLAMACYFAGAVGATLTPDFVLLVFFRALQGVGGAMFALGMAIMRSIAGKQLPMAISGIVGGFAIGIIAGFGSSGMITAALGWRWLFGIEAMMIPLMGFLVWRFLPDPGDRTDVGQDARGSLLLGIGIATLLLGVTFGPPMGWGSVQVMGLLVISFPLMIVWYRRERRLKEPLIDVKVLRERNILLANLAAALAGYAAFSTYLLVPRLALTPEHVGGLHAAHPGLGLALPSVGLLMMPVGFGTLIGAISGGVLSRRVSGRWTFVAGMSLLTIGPALLATARVDAYAIGVWLLITGAGFGFSVSAAGTLVTQSAPAESTGVATALNSLSRLVGGGLGSQVATVILIVSRFPGVHISPAWGYAVPFGIAAALSLAGAALVSAVRPGQSAPAG